MSVASEMHECLNEDRGVAGSTDARSDSVVDSRIRCEPMGGTGCELSFFRTDLRSVPVHKTAIG